MPTIILDRDGVLNYDSSEYIKSPEEWRPIPGSLVAVAQLNRAGYAVYVATNQSGIARGLYTIETLDLIHEKLFDELASVGGYVEAIVFCPHHPDENCACRKPKPGLLYQIRDKFKVELSQCYFIGDSMSDVRAAQAAGCLPILVLSGNGKRDLAAYPELATVPCFETLRDAVDFVLEKK